MAVAVWLVWRRNSFAGATVPMVLFGAQLTFNGAWSWLLFGLHSPGAALVDLVLLWTAIAATTVTFWRRSIPAAILLVPYLIWASFAGALNFAIWRLNG
jgi:benzodiazapine receptor